MASAPEVAVVGGGIAGLSAAWELCRISGADGSRCRVTVLEADDRLGGKLQSTTFAGRPVDLGADAFLTRRPEALQLCRELGMQSELVAPATGTAYVWSRGMLRQLPRGLALGVPTRIGPLARSGILSPLGLARAALDVVAPIGRAEYDQRRRRHRPPGPSPAGPPSGGAARRPADRRHPRRFGAGHERGGGVPRPAAGGDNAGQPHGQPARPCSAGAARRIASCAGVLRRARRNVAVGRATRGRPLRARGRDAQELGRGGAPARRTMGALRTPRRDHGSRRRGPGRARLRRRPNRSPHPAAPGQPALLDRARLGDPGHHGLRRHCARGSAPGQRHARAPDRRRHGDGLHVDVGQVAGAGPAGRGPRPRLHGPARRRAPAVPRRRRPGAPGVPGARRADGRHGPTHAIHGGPVPRRLPAVRRRALGARGGSGAQPARLGGLALAGAALQGVGIPACIASGRRAAKAVTGQLEQTVWR